MFDFIKKLFGRGWMRFSGTTQDGRTFTARAPFIGDPHTFTKDDLEDAKNSIEVKYNVKIASIKLDDLYDSTTGFRLQK